MTGKKKFVVSPRAQREYRVIGGTEPTGADEVARAALNKAKAKRLNEDTDITFVIGERNGKKVPVRYSRLRYHLWCNHPGHQHCVKCGVWTGSATSYCEASK